MERLKNKKLFLFDIDGTLSVGNTLFEGTKELLMHIEQIGGKSYYITNNSTKSGSDYVKKFAAWDLRTEEADFITAGYITIRYLKEHYSDKKIHVMGTDSFVSELVENGFDITTEVEPVSCVLVAFDSELNYEKLTKVCEILQTQEVDYLATNPDLRCPAPFGFIPDCGAMCNLIAQTVDRLPEYLGKPNKEMVTLCMKQSGFTEEDTLVVGDRLYTDIACGINAGVDTCVVFTGEAKREDVSSGEYIPAYCFETIKDLLEEIK